MTIDAMQEMCLRQIGEDVSDLDEYEDLINQYLNEGYRALMYKRKGGDMTGVGEIAGDIAGANALPDWTHQAIVDYATYLLLRNGNALKQQRAQMYYGQYQTVYARMRSEAEDSALSENDGKLKLKNLYN